MIINTATSLEKQLQEITYKLQVLFQECKISDDDAAEHKRLQEEKDSIEKCLEICNDASEASRLEEFSAEGRWTSGRNRSKSQRGQEDKNSCEPRPIICAEASEQMAKPRINVFEDVLAAQDSHQVIISTSGDLIMAVRVTAGIRATQWIGHMSDSPLKELSHDRGAGWYHREGRQDQEGNK
jgi:hypothetical protein